MKVPSKLISYFEKRIQELECHKSDLEASLKDRSRQLDPRHRETHKSDLIQLHGEIRAMKTTLKYIKGGRWMK
jgi:hypothetical protein